MPLTSLKKNIEREISVYKPLFGMIFFGNSKVLAAATKKILNLKKTLVPRVDDTGK